jgi:NitT/TauT family transport system substrate-binding protein
VADQAEVELGFRAFDAHELLCHLVADRLGCYRDEGVEVRLADLTFRADDPLQVSCGSALLAALAGRPYKIVFVASARPLFWLVAARPAAITGLAGARVATFPQGSPPWHLLRIVLRRAGLEPDRDVAAMPARDDAARLGLLRTGAVDAALVTSAAAPGEVARLGLTSVSFLGDELAVPTTGLAVHADFLAQRGDVVASIVRAQRRALGAIHGDDPAAAAVLSELAGDERAAAALHDVVRRCFSRDGTIASAEAETAVELLRAELRLDAAPSGAVVYDFSPLA